MAVRFCVADVFSALWTLSTTADGARRDAGAFCTITRVVSFSFSEFTVDLFGLFEVSPDIGQRLGCPLIHFCRQ